ncbi:MAG: histidine phosphatase family protein [Oscillospiraceae bacterium]|nr:histidine phosphatase family protein [Oscillospiraceae bacterium]
MVNLYIVRHGETVNNVLRVIQGWANSALTEKGIAQAIADGKMLENVHFDSAWASELKRQQETAQLILDQNKTGSVPEISIDNGLKELSYGKYDGLSYVLLNEGIGKATGIYDYREYRSKVGNMVFADVMASTDETGAAETCEVLQTRMMNTINRICRETEEAGGGNVLMVSSGASMGLLMPILDKVNGDKAYVNNGGVVSIRYENGEYEVLWIRDPEL